ncbi:MAG: hypothetical protein K6A44_01025 [bacterium]|nr:hypothetical protein [bacterium]
MDISKIQFEQLSQSNGMDKAFEDFDVNNDGKINQSDINAAEDSALKTEITNILHMADEESGLDSDADFDTNENATKSSENAQSTSTSTKTKTLKDGKVVVYTLDASGKKISAKSTDKKGVVRESTYSYNSDGSFVKTTTNTTTGDVATKTYGANGKPQSSIVKDKNGKAIKQISWAYNADGSYTKITTNLTTGVTSTREYDASGKLTSASKINKKGQLVNTKVNYNADGTYTKTKINKNTKAKTVNTYDSSGKIINSVTTSKSKHNDRNNTVDLTTKEVTYSYNADGSYTKKTVTKTERNGNSLIRGDVKVQKFDSNGNEIPEDKSFEDCTYQNGKNYKDYIKSNGVTYVVVGSSGCGICNSMERMLKNNSGGVVSSVNASGANIVYTSNMDNSEYSALVKQFSAMHAGDGRGTLMLVKYVDGKAVSVSDISLSYIQPAYSILEDSNNTPTNYSATKNEHNSHGTLTASTVKNNTTGDTYTWNYAEKSSDDWYYTPSGTGTKKEYATYATSLIIKDSCGKIKEKHTFEKDNNNKGHIEYADGSTEEYTYKNCARYSHLPQKLEATRTLKDGTVLKCTYEYNSDGSYQEIAVNQKTGEKTITKYDSTCQKIS